MVGGAHHINFIAAIPQGDEGEIFSVAGPGWKKVVEWVVGQPGFGFGLDLTQIQLGAAIFTIDINDLLPIG